MIRFASQHFVLSITLFIIFVNANSQQSIPPCGRGSFRNSSGFCQLCPPNTYQDKVDGKDCKRCPLTSFFPFTGAQTSEACISCRGGSFRSVFYSIADQNNFNCTYCPPNQVSVKGICTKCPKGSNTDYFFGCGQCPTGRFGDEEGLVSCKSCPQGTTTIKLGSKSPSDCVPCPPGTAAFGTPTCEACDQFSEFDKETKSCLRCEDGKFAASGGCQLCPTGTFSEVAESGIATTSCTKCPANFTTLAPGANFCRRINGPCPKDFITAPNGNCIKCRDGFRYDPDQSSCRKCPKGTGTFGGSETVCRSCTDIFLTYVNFSEKDGLGKPNECISYMGELLKDPSATFDLFYPDREGCPPGTRVFPSAEIALDIGLPQFCRKCPFDFYSLTYNAMDCQRCPFDSYTSRTGSSECIPCPSGLIPKDGKCVVPQTACEPGLILGPGKLNAVQCVPDCGNGTTPPVKPFDKKCATSIFNFAGCTGCDKCPDGKVRDGGQPFQCNCDSNFATGRVMMKGRCIACSPGSFRKFIPSTRNFECAKCPPGTFWTNITEEELIAADRRLLSTCKPCPVDSFTNHSGAFECTPCPPGTFTYGREETECLQFDSP